MTLYSFYICFVTKYPSDVCYKMYLMLSDVSKLYISNK